MTAELDKYDIRDFTNALKELTVEVRTNTLETKNQTEYFQNNGFTGIVVDKLTRRFGLMIGTVAAIVGIIMLVI